ncbi:MAG: CoA transferase [Acidimicrobiia bacterium]|nr:CoA transferase [Acidimicrobiia bacterium]
MKRFGDLVVVEIAGSLAGGYCGKLFADHGAEVVLVGPSELPPHQSAYVDVGKRPVDAWPAGLLAEADVLIESSADGPVSPTGVGRDDLVHVQLSPFGSSGPYAEWKSSDLIDYAVGGHLYLYGDPDREPLRGPADQPRYATGLFGFIGAMAALWVRRRTAKGQVVEVSHTDAMVSLHQFTFLRYTLGGDTLRRMGNRFTGQGQPNSIYPSADGWVCVSAPAADQVERLLDVTGLADLLDRSDITSPLDFQVLPHVLDDALMPWLAERNTDDIVDLLQAVRVPAAPVSTMQQLLDDPHLADRDYWRPAADGVRRAPGPPFRMSGHRWRQPDRPASVGSDGRRQGTWDPPAESMMAHFAEHGPLAGLKVLDLTRVWAGPLATRMLAELGADVVWVEAPWGRGPRQLPDSLIAATRYYPDNEQGDCQWNRNGHLLKFSLGKRSLALDLATAEGIATFERLVPWADVVIENFSSRVMPHFGLDEDRLHELNSAAVYVTMPGYGRSGPAEHWLAFGSSVDSHAGLSSLIGYADQRPWKGGVAWPDPIAGLHATSALLIALWDRACADDGAGQTIEVAQFEATVAIVGDQLLAHQSGAVLDGSSNRAPDAAPQGVYRCQGDDRWVAITVDSDAAWQALCDHLAGFDDTMRSFDLARRIECHDAIDDIIATWSGARDQRTVVAELQGRGVAAGPVLDAGGVVADPHFDHRNLFHHFDQPEVGPFTTHGIPIRLSATPARPRRRAPLLGEHNAEVLAEAGRLTAGEIDSLAAADVIADRPPE